MLRRFSEALLGTQHPWDEAVSEASALYHHPLDTLAEATRQAAMIPVHVASSIIPLPQAMQEAEQGNYAGAGKSLLMGPSNIGGGPEFAGDLANRNYGGAVGTLAADMAGAALPGVGDVADAIEPEAATGAARTLSDVNDWVGGADTDTSGGNGTPAAIRSPWIQRVLQGNQ